MRSGFYLLHQGFADRFFPGTSVLHTRIRYALFVPWLYKQAASGRRRGSDLESMIRRLLIELAIRLKREERYDVIGGDKLGQLTSQPADRVYWTALRAWGLLLPTVSSRSDALRRLQITAGPSATDDDGGRLDDAEIEAFVGLPDPPEGWKDPDVSLNFNLSEKEGDYLRRKLSVLPRPREGVRSLLACLVSAGDSFDDKAPGLPKELDVRADALDGVALGVARDAAALAAIGRAVYGALVEQLRERDGGPEDHTFREQLHPHFASYGEAASHTDLDAAEALLPELPLHVRTVLRETLTYVREGKPENFSRLHDSYRKSEVIRKGGLRARLAGTERAAQRRAEWDPGRHNTSPLHYRWHIVRSMLADLSDSR